VIHGAWSGDSRPRPFLNGSGGASGEGSRAGLRRGGTGMHDLLASPGVAGDNRTSVVASPYQCELSDGAVDERPGHDAVAGKEWRVSGREDYEAPAVEES